MHIMDPLVWMSLFPCSNKSMDLSFTVLPGFSHEYMSLLTKIIGIEDESHRVSLVQAHKL